jgi:hypothetical protein
MQQFCSKITLTLDFQKIAICSLIMVQNSQKSWSSGSVRLMDGIIDDEKVTIKLTYFVCQVTTQLYQLHFI